MRRWASNEPAEARVAPSAETKTVTGGCEPSLSSPPSLLGHCVLSSSTCHESFLSGSAIGLAGVRLASEITRATDGCWMSCCTRYEPTRPVLPTMAREICDAAVVVMFLVSISDWRKEGAMAYKGVSETYIHGVLSRGDKLCSG